MANVLFRRGAQTYIDNNVPLVDGQVIFNETDQAIYLDSADSGTLTRTRYGGGNLSRSDVDATLSTSSINPIQNKAVANAINTLNTKVSKTEVLISNSRNAYSSSKAYAVGDLCIYNNVLYRCITACSAGSWATNQSCFTADTLIGVANYLNAGLNIFRVAYVTFENKGYNLYRPTNNVIVIGSMEANFTFSGCYIPNESYIRIQEWSNSGWNTVSLDSITLKCLLVD
jgi:hypothetical protein